MIWSGALVRYNTYLSWRRLKIWSAVLSCRNQAVSLKRNLWRGLEDFKKVIYERIFLMFHSLKSVGVIFPESKSNTFTVKFFVVSVLPEVLQFCSKYTLEWNCFIRKMTQVKKKLGIGLRQNIIRFTLKKKKKKKWTLWFCLVTLYMIVS